jgi:SET domain
LRSLLFRYSLLYSQHSPTAIEKVSFDNQTVSAGLKATAHIGAATWILSTCGSMSSDIHHYRGVSVIQSHHSQLGPSGPRLILGPFRFANHDCAPNCQVCVRNSTHLQRSEPSAQIAHIPGTYAFCLFALREIEVGESLTVRYTKDGYYDLTSGCRCQTCHPESPPVIKRQTFVSASAIDPSRISKRKHRAGTKHDRTRKNVDNQSRIQPDGAIF